MKSLIISADEMDYLSHKYEIRDHRDIFTWAVKLLYDISKLDEGGWRLSFQKCNFDLANNKVNYEPFNPIHFDSINSLAPNEDGFTRLPSPEFLNERQKIN